MSGPLDDIDSRLRWTGQHIEKIDKEVRAFLDDGPMYEITVEAQPNGRTYLYRVEKGRRLPDDLRFKVGDAFHNLRASLDNIAWALVASRGKPVWNVAFPVCRNGAQFRTLVEAKFAQVDQGAIDIIESFQPYKDPDGKRANWLKILDDRWNRDKHRVPMLVGIIPGSFTYLESDGDVVDAAIYTDKGLKDGMPVGHVTYRTSQHTRRQPHFAFEVALDETRTPLIWRPIPNALQTAHILVRDEVLRRLRSYF